MVLWICSMPLDQEVMSLNPGEYLVLSDENSEIVWYWFLTHMGFFVVENRRSREKGEVRGWWGRGAKEICVKSGRGESIGRGGREVCSTLNSFQTSLKSHPPIFSTTSQNMNPLFKQLMGKKINCFEIIWTGCKKLPWFEKKSELVGKK